MVNTDVFRSKIVLNCIGTRSNYDQSKETPFSGTNMAHYITDIGFKADG